MARLIDADKYPCKKCGKTYCHQNCEMFWDWIRNTVDAVPVVHGRWVDGRPYVNSRWKVCSVCHQTAPEPHGGYNYCPNCGAKMDLEVKDA